MPDGAFNTSDGCTIAYTLHPARDPHDLRAPRIVLIHSLALDWVERREITQETYPPGLATGIAGPSSETRTPSPTICPKPPS